ncbi:protein vav-like isoform X2 [Daphnia pulex]|uniref:protein vav-like isoform X2 n=1 Tax=Daphnia pulex TaxID=6669 RepID=UPI001EDF6777|nr:protein vav-like isoform X2 [Daphnia pulex]XP_046448805.1 protein vav-like isoform X2 [Daphnia pulex]XP_046640431.1 protein vav-like isoform X2 [Daphnia pulicaria]
MAGSSQRVPLWRECVDWLDRLKILRSDQFPPNSELIHFGQCIRDGFILCYLITKLDPNALDFHDVCQRTQMSQYMSLKNIRLFLRACRNKFDLADSDLFEPAMLFDYTDFGKVLRTLSKLSKCSKVAQKGIEGFPAVDSRQYVEDDEIYRRLEDIDQQEDQYCEYNYAVTGENIYEELCSVGEHNKSPQTHHPFPQPPVVKREYSIRELVESEKRYIEALNMIKTNFIVPLSSVLREDEKKCVFHGIEELHEIHTGLYSDLIKACTTNNAIKLHMVFLNWKDKFLIYGSICSNLSSARRAIKSAICRSREVAEKIERCQREASEVALNLEDLITLPMQRLLKYPLLLGNLCKHTEKSHEDYHDLQLAYEAMVDIADYTNESTRDYEMRQIIKDVQASISNWNTMENCDLVEYGRLIKDGELKMRSHEESRNAKTRYVFLFNRGVIFCKATRGDQYSFKLFLSLEKFKLEDHPTSRNQNGREIRWSHQWLLVDNQNKTAYTLYAKSAEAKNKWIGAFSETLEKLNPAESWGSDHNYEFHTFSNSISCHFCKKLLKGSFLQGYRCNKCSVSVHRECLGSMTKSCGVPIPPPRPRQIGAKLTSPAFHHIDLERYPWFAGEMTRTAAEAVLRNTPLGTYLLRFKSNDNTYALSLRTGEEIKHMKVVHTSDNGGRYFLSESFLFRSIVELINRYEHNSLRESFKGLDAYLKVPWKHLFATAQVIKEYVPDDVDLNQLSISKGQHLIVVSKEGDENGWWKGRFNDQDGYFPKDFVKEDKFYEG